MNMVNLVLFILSTIGLTNILVYGKIFDVPRNFLRDHLPEKVFEVLECYQCTGFWAGLLTGFVMLSHSLPVVLMAGFAGSFLSHFAALLAEYIEANTAIPFPFADGPPDDEEYPYESL
jgi:hypothetical protein